MKTSQNQLLRVRKMEFTLGVRTCEVFLCFVAIMFVLSIVLTSLFSLFYTTRERNRFLHCTEDEPKDG